MDGPIISISWLIVVIDLYQPHSPEEKKPTMQILRSEPITNLDLIICGIIWFLKPMVWFRKHHYAIIDEVDSVLIDDARTPLIIFGPV